MKKKKGIHFYINVSNFNDIVEDEERRGGVNHSIHALDTLFTLTEQFGKRNYPDVFVIEKITGARLHMYLYGEPDDTYEMAASVISYAFEIAEFMGSDIGKYKTLLQFEIQAGVAAGSFYEYIFNKEEYEEMTTIGFACNYAAKLQGLTNSGHITVSEDVYNSISDAYERSAFVRRTSPSITKYKQSCYYEAKIAGLKRRVLLTERSREQIRNYANQRNLTGMKFPNVTQSLSLEKLSSANGRRIEGIPVFADVRDFTSQFKPDDSNLEKMAEKTRQILEKLYTTTVGKGGVHVQFQGDREFVLFHNVGEQKCFKEAVLGGMRMIDAVKPYSVHIGVGEAFGKMYAVKIGARGEKDKLIIGRTVNEADRMEDEKAAEDQLAISTEVYEGLRIQDSYLAKQFRPEGNVYITCMGFSEYTDRLKFAKHTSETKGHGYNGAWGKADK